MLPHNTAHIMACERIYIEDITKEIAISAQDVKLSPVHQKALSNCALYRVDTDHGTSYGYIPVYASNGKVQRYFVHRYISNLPMQVKLSNADVRLPTIDHINRDPMDNRCCNLRMCTFHQNTANMCYQRKGSTKTYHGISNAKCDEKKRKYTCGVNARTPCEKKLLDKIKIWCRMFDHYLDTRPTIPERQLRYVSTTECCSLALERLTEWQEYAPLMDEFATEMIEMLETTGEDSAYTPTMDRRHIPTALYTKWPLLKKILKRAPVVIASACYSRLFVAGMPFDIYKYILYKSFAHTNFFGVLPPPPRIIVQEPETAPTPADVLNAYEQEQEAALLERVYREMGYGDETIGKVRRYEMVEGEDGLQVVHCTFVDRDPTYVSKLTILDDYKDDVELSSPLMAYRFVSMKRC